MKKFLSLILIFIVLSASVTAFADMEKKLEGHWSENMIERDFVAYYFPYLAKGNFEKFDPVEAISSKDFSLSFSSLSKNYQLGSVPNNIVPNKGLTRKEVVRIVGNKLKEVETLRVGNEQIPFKDIDTMDEENIESLKLLYNLEIIKGVSNDRFAPEKTVSQAEAIIILQRIRNALDTMDEISFTIKGIVQSYNNQETIIVKQNGDKVLLTITKEFPTPGYNLNIDKILREDNNRHQVYLDITPPVAGSILPQVITYKTITVEIDETELNGQSPYVFVVEGLKSGLLR